MDLHQLRQLIENKLDSVRAYVNKDVKIIIRDEAINEFRENFEKESFDGTKWKDVKRRDPSSPWYGRSGQREKKSDSSKTAKILHESKELKGAISGSIEDNRVIISNDKPYARVHNEGLPAKIYGKTPFQMPKRQFIGATDKLISKIRNKAEREIQKILNS